MAARQPLAMRVFALASFAIIGLIVFSVLSLPTRDPAAGLDSYAASVVSVRFTLTPVDEHGRAVGNASASGAVEYRRPPLVASLSFSSNQLLVPLREIDASGPQDCAAGYTYNSRTTHCDPPASPSPSPTPAPTSAPAPNPAAVPAPAPTPTCDRSCDGTWGPTPPTTQPAPYCTSGSTWNGNACAPSTKAASYYDVTVPVDVDVRANNLASTISLVVRAAPSRGQFATEVFNANVDAGGGRANGTFSWRAIPADQVALLKLALTATVNATDLQGNLVSSQSSTSLELSSGAPQVVASRLAIATIGTRHGQIVRLDDDLLLPHEASP